MVTQRVNGGEKQDSTQAVWFPNYANSLLPWLGGEEEGGWHWCQEAGMVMGGWGTGEQYLDFLWCTSLPVPFAEG